MTATQVIDRQLSTRRRWQLLLTVVFVVAFVATSLLWGLQQSGDRVSLWVLGALLIASLGRPRGWTRVLVDFVPLLVVLTLYDFLRGQAKGFVGHVFTYPQIRVDEWLFGGTIPTVTLQRAFYTPGHVHVWDYVAFLIYLSYFFVPIIVAGLLWKFAHHRFHRFVALWVGLAMTAFVTYALYPASPPWMASDQGHIPRLTRIAPVISQQFGVNAARIMGSQQFVNRVAAVPSLHAATILLITFFFWPLTRRWRWVLVSYPIAMGVALVYMGEHYAFDVLLGWLYAVIVYVVGSRLWDRWALRRAARALAG
jgi:membrane-associated phospholipid phosphatase